MPAPYGYVDDLIDIALGLEARIEGNKGPLGIMDVYLGDQDKIPRTPSCCIEPVTETKELEGAPNITLNTFEVEILVYHSQIQSVQENLREALVLAGDVKAYLHQDLRLLDGAQPRVIHGYVTSTESGFTFKERSLYRAVRMTWRGINKTSLSG